MKKQAEKWLIFAENDIKSAIKLNEEEYLTQNAAFFCQQAVEKSFKAVLENNEEIIPKIHNLEIYLKELRKLSNFKLI